MRQSQRYLKRTCCMVLATLVAVLISSISPVLAAPDQTRDKLNQTLSELERLEQEISSDISSMKNDVYDLSDSLRSLQDEMADTQDQIDAQLEMIDFLENAAQQQREAMQVRIRFSYENSDQISLNQLLKKNMTMGEFLNQQEYIKSILEYDRNKIDEYEENMKMINSEKKVLEELYQKKVSEQADLETQQEQLLQKISENETKLTQTQERKQNTQEQLDALMEKMKRYESAYQVAYTGDMSLEERLAKQAESEGSSGRPVTAGASEEALLAAIIFCESGGESYESQLAVASVVLNRVNSSWFPNTITEVIYAHRQFSPVASGRLSVVLANGLTTESCRQAAHQVLYGSVTGNWLYFRVNDGSRSGTVIGEQVFY